MSNGLKHLYPFLLLFSGALSPLAVFLVICYQGLKASEKPHLKSSANLECCLSVGQLTDFMLYLLFIDMDSVPGT